ncbi:TIGR02206 family membrane protein [Paenibacillus sp. GCM10027627]|uniref:YwaF family protein n=1 Tax=unclassified Paenibacillus TaxID=185978 RepID=UPI0036445F6E
MALQSATNNRSKGGGVIAFELFSTQHMAALVVSVIVFSCVVLFRRQIRIGKIDRIFRLLLASFLLICELSLQLSFLTEGSWGAASLPLQLCSLTLLLSVVLLAFRAKALYGLVFFLGTAGALQALATPNLGEAFPHFRFFQFFAAHIGIILAALYVFVVERYRPTLKSAFAALAWLHVLAVPAAIANMAFGTNFMFLARKPETASLLDALAPWPWYLLQLEFVALASCLLLLVGSKLVYAIFRGKKR